MNLSQFESTHSTSGERPRNPSSILFTTKLSILPTGLALRAAQVKCVPSAQLKCVAHVTIDCPASETASSKTSGRSGLPASPRPPVQLCAHHFELFWMPLTVERCLYYLFMVFDSEVLLLGKILIFERCLDTRPFKSFYKFFSMSACICKKLCLLEFEVWVWKLQIS